MSGFIHILHALRPKQWTKNAVVLAALVFAAGDRAQHIDASHAWLALAAMVVFCVVSSAVYLMNDIRDVELDRLHPTKRLRPIAAGQVSIGAARAMAIALMAAGFAAAWRIGTPFLCVIAGYVLLQVCYTFGLKQVALVDLFVIASGFVLRALAGAVAINVTISPWLLLCTLLLALFLALCKRRHELVVVNDTSGETRPSLRKYDERLLDQLISIMAAATVVCYALYTLSPETVQKFGTNRLGFTIPFVLFGLFRYLDLVYRHEKGGRPEQILLTDVPLMIDLALYGATVAVVLFTL
ncbi:MAG TPA: decaprenyl-phosphate phosphoribosyltransferase [Kiritimatiellia bacterium]